MLGSARKLNIKIARKVTPEIYYYFFLFKS